MHIYKEILHYLIQSSQLFTKERIPLMSQHCTSRDTLLRLTLSLLHRGPDYFLTLSDPHQVTLTVSN